MNSPQTLFDSHLPPLAERVRPKTIQEFYGQGHLVDEGKILHRLLDQSASFSMIFWGPPGTGKTTLARMIAKSSDAKIRELSVVSSGVKDLREVIVFAKNNREMGIKRSCLSMRSTASVKASRIRCSELWKTEQSPLLVPPRKTRLLK